MDLQDRPIRRGVRERCAVGDVPAALWLIDPEARALLVRWVRRDAASRSRASLLGGAGGASIERCDALCERLLREGWITRRETLVGGHWRWETLSWRDLGRLQALLGVTSRDQRDQQRAAALADLADWLGGRAEGTDSPRGLELELAQAQAALSADRAIRLETLSARIQQLHALAAWVDAKMQGTRRDFALHAAGHTKSISAGDWTWLDQHIDLERHGIQGFTPLFWIAGELELAWQQHCVHLGAVRFLPIPIEDLFGIRAASPRVARWWLIENRASFERQAAAHDPGTATVWLPGRPSPRWLEAMAHLLTLAPAPLQVSADADPAGVEIALSVGRLWAQRNLPWAPHRMGVEEWQHSQQHWPLNDYDRLTLARLRERRDLPQSLRTLCERMEQDGRKAEQEQWL